MNRKSKILILILLIVLSVGYALLSSNVTIGSMFNVKKNVFSVTFDKLGSITNGTADYKDYHRQEIDFNCTFDKPSDRFSFYVDIVNNGTMDAMINDFGVRGLEEYSDYLEFNVEYYNGDYFSVGNVLKAGVSEKLFVTVTYKESVTELPDNDININNYSFYIDYVRDDGTGFEHRGYKASRALLNNQSTRTFLNNSGTTRVIITNIGIDDVSDSKYVDLDDNVDNTEIVGWVDGDTAYISCVDENTYVRTRDCTMLFGYNGANYRSWCASVNYIDVTYLDTSECKTFVDMFACVGYNTSVSEVTFVGLENLNTYNMVEANFMFFCTAMNVTNSFRIDVSNWDVHNLENANYMFNNVGGGASDWSIGDLSNWNTKNLRVLSCMFRSAGRGANNWTIGDIGKWDLRKAEDMSYMFNATASSAKNVDLSCLTNLDVSHVTNMKYMFSDAFKNVTSDVRMDLSKWNVSHVTNMNNMFYECGYSTKHLYLGDLSKWNVSNVTNFESIFNCCGMVSLTYDVGDLSNWNTRSATTMYNMFYKAYPKASYSLDLSKWNVSLVTNHNYFSSFVTDKITEPNWVN